MELNWIDVGGGGYDFIVIRTPHGVVCVYLYVYFAGSKVALFGVEGKQKTEKNWN